MNFIIIVIAIHTLLVLQKSQLLYSESQLHPAAHFILYEINN
jgi:hypothetical protein